MPRPPRERSPRRREVSFDALYRVCQRHRTDQFTAKKEAKRLEKLAKAAAKQSVATPQNAGPKKEKKVKEKKEEQPAEEWVNPTPPGEKKGEYT